MGLYIFYAASFVLCIFISIVDHMYKWIPFVIVLYIAVAAVFYMIAIAPVKNRDHRDDNL
ncbi:MAG: hypothetical protein Q8934_19715 [Bacillota bacterium]|nr:hypothetical protein [Bacillota bacterium]